eukprot:gene36988-41870_t
MVLRPIAFGVSSASNSIIVGPNVLPLVLSRLHRWTRGDWQLLPFLLRPHRWQLSPINRLKLLDNLRRSLVTPASLLLLLLAMWGVGLSLGAALGLAVAAQRGDLARIWNNLRTMLLSTVLRGMGGGRVSVDAPATPTGQLPYAIAIAAGTVLHLARPAMKTTTTPLRSLLASRALHACGALLLAGVWLVFCYSHVLAWRHTGAWSYLLFAGSESLVAMLFLLRDRPAAVSDAPLDWLLAL